ncbi:transposase [Streptomyces sp. NBC_01023]|uniref:transposase n=1 Tax=Streptomyces sp. NBC_01023 TaxID=2903724 RepID=UPI00386A088C|nr:transposase [Streptomyces sp. NBC_01023]
MNWPWPGCGLAYALQVKGEMTAHAEAAVPHQPPYGGLGPRPLPRYRTRPIGLREHVLAAGRARAVTVTWRKGSKAAMSARFVFLRVRLAGRRPKPAPDGVIAIRWLIAQWPEGENEPVKYWISNLQADIPPRDLVRLAKLRWRIEHDYRELKTTLGLDHFEGRSFTGWHRHVTLVTAAHLFLTEQRTCPKAPARA